MSRIKQKRNIRLIGVVLSVVVIVVLSITVLVQVQESKQRQETLDNHFKDALVGASLIYSKDITYNEDAYWNHVLNAYSHIRYARLNQNETSYADNRVLSKLIDYMYFDILEGYSPSREEVAIIYDTGVVSKMYVLLNDLTSENLAKEINDYLIVTKEEQFDKTSVVEKPFVFEPTHEIPIYERLALNSDVLSQPAFGPIFKLNVYAVNMTDSLEIGEELDDNFTEIRLKGIIPTWYLKDHSGSTSSTELGSFKYVLGESLLYLTPEANAVVVNDMIDKGTVAYLIADYHDWYYVEMVRPLDSNTIYNGWIKKNNLGNYKDFESNLGLEVKIKDGFIPEGYQKFKHGLWGKILEESEMYYSLGLYGASYIQLEKEHVEGFYDN